MVWLQRYNGVICYVFCPLFSLFVLYCMSALIHIQVMGGQHRWAPAYLAACHIYTLLCTIMNISLANKIVVVVVVLHNYRVGQKWHPFPLQ